MAYTLTHNYDLDLHEFDWSVWLWSAIAITMFLIVIYSLIDSGSALKKATGIVEEFVP